MMSWNGNECRVILCPEQVGLFGPIGTLWCHPPFGTAFLLQRKFSKQQANEANSLEGIRFPNPDAALRSDFQKKVKYLPSKSNCIANAE